MGYRDNAESRWNGRKQATQGAQTRGVLVPVSHSAQITINVSAETVWEVLQDPMITRITLPGFIATFDLPDTPAVGVGKRVVRVQRLSDGRQIAEVQELVEFEQGHRVVWNSLGVPKGYHSTTEVVPAGDHATVVRLTVATQVPTESRERLTTEWENSLGSSLERLREHIEARNRN